MRSWVILSLFCLFSCSTQPPAKVAQPLINIIEVDPNRRTHLTKQNLEHLFKVYDLVPFVFTQTVQIQSMSVPHSHPIITLNTRYMDSPNKLLSSFIHEQLHWWAMPKTQAIESATIDLAKTFPLTDVENKNRSAHQHLIICYLEFKALSHFIGEREARKVLTQFMNDDQLYPWHFQQVLERGAELEKILKKHNLEKLPIN